MRFPESQKGITLFRLIAALALPAILVAIGIGALHRSKSQPKLSGGETASPNSARITVVSRPGMPDDCVEMLGTLHNRVEAWARTTTDTDAIGDKSLCLEAKRYSVKVGEHCLGLHNFANLDGWCESQSFVHAEVLLRRRERVRNCTELADDRDTELDAWRSSASNPENASYKRRLCLVVKESTETFNRQCAGVTGMTAQQIPAGWCESDSFDASSVRYVRRANR